MYVQYNPKRTQHIHKSSEKLIIIVKIITVGGKSNTKLDGGKLCSPRISHLIDLIVEVKIRIREGSRSCWIVPLCIHLSFL